MIGRGGAMSNAAVIEAIEAGRIARALVDRERSRGNDRAHARANVARAIGAAPGTIENLTRDRLKSIAGWLRDALRALIIKETEAEIKRLQHELTYYRALGADTHRDEMAEISASVEALLCALNRKPV